MHGGKVHMSCSTVDDEMASNVAELNTNVATLTNEILGWKKQVEQLESTSQQEVSDLHRRLAAAEALCQQQHIDLQQAKQAVQTSKLTSNLARQEELQKVKTELSEARAQSERSQQESQEAHQLASRAQQEAQSQLRSAQQASLAAKEAEIYHRGFKRESDALLVAATEKQGHLQAALDEATQKTEHFQQCIAEEQALGKMAEAGCHAAISKGMMAENELKRLQAQIQHSKSHYAAAEASSQAQLRQKDAELTKLKAELSALMNTSEASYKFEIAVDRQALMKSLQASNP